MSPACRAPDSEMAPAMRLIMMALGLEEEVRRAKTSWVSLEMPETGLRSVSPRARTPMRERSSARRRERTVRGRGMRLAKTMCVEAIQRTREKRRPPQTMRFETRCSGGASRSASAPSAVLSGLRRSLIDDWLM